MKIFSKLKFIILIKHRYKLNYRTVFIPYSCKVTINPPKASKISYNKSNLTNWTAEFNFTKLKFTKSWATNIINQLSCRIVQDTNRVATTMKSMLARHIEFMLPFLHAQYKYFAYYTHVWVPGRRVDRVPSTWGSWSSAAGVACCLAPRRCWPCPSGSCRCAAAATGSPRRPSYPGRRPDSRRATSTTPTSTSACPSPLDVGARVTRRKSRRIRQQHFIRPVWGRLPSPWRFRATVLIFSAFPRRLFYLPIALAFFCSTKVNRKSHRGVPRSFWTTACTTDFWSRLYEFYKHLTVLI